IDIHYGNIFRMSGDECAILVVDDDTDDNLKEKAKKIYKEIRYRIDENIEKSGYDIFYNISAGATGFDAKKDDFDKIIQKARFSLHSAKIKGKNRFNYFNENEYEAYIKKLGIQDELRRCINNDFEGFKLVYQPIVSNSTEKVIGAEALLRWESTKYGYMSPVEFIPLLEESALIIPLGKWITKTAACQCDKWVKNIPDFVMHINLSFVQIVKSDAIRDMVENISKFTPSNSHYVFEVTESVQMDANSTIQRVLDGFNENGFALAIDDFGTGYSNFGYMKDKVFGILKIDRSFITDIQSKHNNYTLVNFMIKMAHEMGISVCIEGVETKEELDCVSVLSPDFIQGYYYGKPVDEDTFYKMHLGA
ncbi:MAG: GGDEF domain-containing phosphodiesterase, partial [Lachnospira sp.]|nr:GGDEF domain-containing phosphodiesterase [Lachnospira sp.]